VTCPGCQQAAPFHGHRRTSVVSLFGPIRLFRAYYHCRHCGQGCFPFDHEAGFGEHRLTPGAERVGALLGLTCDGFEEAAKKVLPEACGLRLSESTVQRLTEDAGARLEQLHEAGHTLGDAKPFKWHKDAKGRTCAYFSADATSVPQQAKDGGKAEGRMPYVAAIYNPAPEKPKAAKGQPLATPGYEPVAEKPAAQDALPERGKQAALPEPGGPQAPGRPRMQGRYVAGLLSLAELGLLMRQQAAQVGAEKAEQWLAMSDGGSGLEEMLRSNFNRANLVCILDFHHPAGYLERLALAVLPDDEEKRKEQATAWCHKLKHQGGQAMLDELAARAPPKGKAAQAVYQEVLTYFRNQVHRMNYPYYLSQGWQIGSGPIESACKTVVGQRLKQAGMRWREHGTDTVCNLRALFRSEKDQWDAFWERKVNKRPISYQRI
jgi:hypothetical protein